MGSALMVGCRSPDIQEICFQAAKRSNMDCVKVQWRLFPKFQEWHFHAAKRLYKINTIRKEDRFAHSPE